MYNIIYLFNTIKLIFVSLFRKLSSIKCRFENAGMRSIITVSMIKMKIYIILILVFTICNTCMVYSQISKLDTDHLTAYAIYMALEPANKLVREKAAKIISHYPGDYNIEQVCAIFDYVFQGWKYQSDTGGMEYFEKGSDAVATLTGDCADYSIAMISLIESIGWDGRIVCVSDHTYPELFLGMNLSENDIIDISDKINNYFEYSTARKYSRKINFHRDDDRSFWLNLDYQENRPGCRYYEPSTNTEHLVIYSNGKYRLAFLNNE